MDPSSIDCQAIVTCARPQEPGVFYCGPGTDKFVFYSPRQWESVATSMLDAVKCKSVQVLLDKREAGTQTYVFCWAKAGPLPGVPMFWADISMWVYAQPLRRSARLGAKVCA